MYREVRMLQACPFVSCSFCFSGMASLGDPPTAVGQGLWRGLLSYQGVLLVLPCFLTQYLMRNSLCLLLGFVFRQVLELQLLKQSIWLSVKTVIVIAGLYSDKVLSIPSLISGVGAQTSLGLQPHLLRILLRSLLL